MVKGIWSIILSIPVIILVCFVHNPEVLVVYTGGICGTFILFLFPVALVSYARKFKKEKQLKESSIWNQTLTTVHSNISGF